MLKTERYWLFTLTVLIMDFVCLLFLLDFLFILVFLGDGKEDFFLPSFSVVFITDFSAGSSLENPAGNARSHSCSWYIYFGTGTKAGLA